VLGYVWATQFERSTMSSGIPPRYVSPAAVNLRSDQDETLVFESRFESANLAKAVHVYVPRSSFILLFVHNCLRCRYMLLIKGTFDLAKPVSD